MKQLNCAFSEKSELQLLGCSILSAINGNSSMSGSQNDMLQQIFFEIELYFLATE